MANTINLGKIIGAKGDKGDKGDPGANGENGLTPYISNGFWWIGTTNTNVVAKGNEWFSGISNPTTEGINGDLYLNTATDDIFKKENNVWSLITNIKGAKGDKGEKGDTALSVEIGSVESGEIASVTNSGTDTDLVLDFVLPKGTKGDKGDKGDPGATNIAIGGFIVDRVDFETNPQSQLNYLNENKLDKNLGTNNAGKYLKVSATGDIEAVESSAENDVIDCYIVGDTPYANDWLSEINGGSPLSPKQGILYIIRTAGEYYLRQVVWTGLQYEQTGGGDINPEDIGAVPAIKESSEIINDGKNITIISPEINLRGRSTLAGSATLDTKIEATKVNIISSNNSLSPELRPDTKTLIITTDGIDINGFNFKLNGESVATSTDIQNAILDSWEASY